MLRQSTRLISAFTGNNAVQSSSAKYTVIGVPTQPPPAATTTVRDGKVPGQDKSEDVPHEWKDIKGVMEGEKKHGGERGQKKQKGAPRGVVDSAKETMDKAKTKTKETLEEAEEKSKEAFNTAKNKLKETLFKK